jgi:hypothetical protein
MDGQFFFLSFLVLFHLGTKSEMFANCDMFQQLCDEAIEFLYAKIELWCMHFLKEFQGWDKKS